MAIVNRTPDSFYDRGANFADDAAKAASRIPPIAEGADVIDVGGVKPGPGERITEAETARVVPFIEWLRGTRTRIN